MSGIKWSRLVIYSVFMRYYYLFTSFIRYFFFRDRFLKQLNFSANNLNKYLLVMPCIPPSGIVVIHLHGMGDTMWTAFKDGVSIFFEQLGAILIIPEFRECLWCTDETLDDLNNLIEMILNQYPDARIIINGTSMGGSIALSLLTERNIRLKVSGVIATSASTRLDSLFDTTSSTEVHAALENSFPDGKISLRKRSLHYNLEEIAIPLVFIYSRLDQVIPSSPVIETASLLQGKGSPVKLIEMERLKGHYRPVRRELVEAYKWLIQKTG